MGLSYRTRDVTRIVAAGALAAAVALLWLRLGVGVEIVKKAAGINDGDAQGVAHFVNGANALVKPALVMLAAVAPLALIAGGAVLLFGGRRGLPIIGTALGVLLLVGSVTALVN